MSRDSHTEFIWCRVCGSYVGKWYDKDHLYKKPDNICEGCDSLASERNDDAKMIKLLQEQLRRLMMKYEAKICCQCGQVIEPDLSDPLKPYPYDIFYGCSKCSWGIQTDE